jgi:TP901 family phage tail tape measure protein
MASFGIQALDANGKLRDMGDVVEEIGNRWNTLSRNQQVALAQTIAGTRQYSRMMSLFDNWDMYEEALNTSKGSAGTLQKQQDTYLESTEAHLEKLGATAEDLYASLFDTEDVNSLIDMLAKLVDGVDNFVEAIGGGAGVLRNFGSIAFNVFNK